jgi:transcriptional repressor NrdR
MAGLKGLDDVAYVRFASVYKNFREAKDFEDLLGTLGDGLLAVGAETDASPDPEEPEPDAPPRRRAVRS